MLAICFQIETPEKVDGFQVFAAAVLVRNPLPLFARIIEVKHGSHRIDTQSVNVITLQPEHCARHQKTANFGSAVIENESLPVGMKTLARIGVLVEVSAVKIREPV